MITVDDRSLLVASNRLPVKLHRNEDGSWTRRPGSGGLVTALEPVLARQGGVWVGWPGLTLPEADGLTEAVRKPRATADYELEPVLLSEDERDGFYLGFANQILWPLCHGFPNRCRFDPTFWTAYRDANRKYARSIRKACSRDRFIWVHDYHLLLTAMELRRTGCENRIGYFHHIPFPPPDTLEQLPWSDELLRAMLHFDLVGFQTDRDRRNFLRCVQVVMKGARSVRDSVVRGPTGRGTRVGNFPISIDWHEFNDGASTDAVARTSEVIRKGLEGEKILLGVDRLDYSKGIPEKLRAFERALEKYPDLRGRATLVQLVVPSREAIPEYHEIRREIDRMVGEINGRYSRGAWTPVVYRFGTWSRKQLLSFYRAADVGVVTSLRDGMNLVSKEFVAASVDGRGVLILSPFAGSVEELGRGALLANPNDVEALSDVIHQACEMPEDEERRRLELLRDRVREWDVHRWVRAYLRAAQAEGPTPTPLDPLTDGPRSGTVRSRREVAPIHGGNASWASPA